MGVIKAGDFKAAAARLARDLHQFGRCDLVAIVRRTFADVDGSNQRDGLPAVPDGMAQKHATALIRKGLLAVGAKIVINRKRHAQKAHTLSQVRRKEARPDCDTFAVMRNCGARRQYARLDVWAALPASTILPDMNALIKRKSRHPGFDQALEVLRSHSFDVAPYAGVAGGVLVSKQGAGVVLVPARRAEDPEGAAVAYGVHPGIVVKGEVARLVDRGYQKFIKTSQYEFPATASQLQAIHAFSEELKQLIGAISLYNESLGTTSDVYRYDRLMGREAEDDAPVQPWEMTDGH